MRNIYLPIILVDILCGMLLQCNMATAESMTIEMLNKKGKEKMLYSENIARIDVGDTITCDGGILNASSSNWTD